MTGGFEVDVDQVRSHANTLKGFQQRAGTAADAGSHLAGLDEAYGILCQPFGEKTREPQEKGAEALAKVENTTGHLADGLTAAADAYQEVEEKVRDILRELAQAVANASAGPEVGR